MDAKNHYDVLAALATADYLNDKNRITL